MEAMRCGNGHVTYPVHPRCPECGEPKSETVDLGDREAVVVTWTVSHASPPGVREPNSLAVVEFTVGDTAVRAVAQTEGDVEVGDTVRPVYVEELRDPDEGIRLRESQEWSGYRFEKTQ